VLRSAIANFASLGYHGTSMRDIARDAGITVASIYHHFPSKQLILQEIMRETLREVIGLTRAALEDAGPSPVDQLAAVMRAWVVFHTERRPEALIGASEMRSLDPDGRAQVVALRDEQQAVFGDIVDRGVRDGCFATTHPREATWAVI